MPQKGGDLGGISGDARFDARVDDRFGGPYIKATTALGAASVTAGVRVDRFGQARSTTIDPRLNVHVGIGRLRTLRFATGVYHQAPAASYYASARGASHLGPMRALHYVAGYETGRETEGLYFPQKAM